MRNVGLYCVVLKDDIPCEEIMVSAKKKSIPTEQVALYERLIATIPEIERKGAANPYTALNGNMFTLLHQSRTLAIRLPQKEREHFLEKYRTTLFEAYGAVMHEYVAVPNSLLKETSKLSGYLTISYEYAKTLKPKATKKKPQARAKNRS
jgi:hypothetical protein